MNDLDVVHCEPMLGGQKSGKSRCAGPCDPWEGVNPEFKEKVAVAFDSPAQVAIVLGATGYSLRPVVLGSNEPGPGVIRLARAVRAFVDARARLNQGLAQACQRVTLMVAGMPVPVGNTAKAI
jgi:adenosyl cobinamide kinase/adenosyl cobinamide phosphate guanylyltransferase